MKLGTHVHHTKTSKSGYSAKPDYACGGCGGHFPKWPLSQKLRGAEPSISTLYIGFARRRFQKKYCQMYHTILSDIMKVILQNGGHFQSITSISETKRRRAFNVDSMYSVLWGVDFRKILPNVSHHSIRHCENHFTKWRPFPKLYVYLRT